LRFELPTHPGCLCHQPYQNAEGGARVVSCGGG